MGAHSDIEPSHKDSALAAKAETDPGGTFGVYKRFSSRSGDVGPKGISRRWVSRVGLEGKGRNI